MLSLVSVLAGRRAAPAPEGPYSDPGAVTLALAAGPALRGAWTRAVASYWAGHRRSASAR